MKKIFIVVILALGLFSCETPVEEIIETNQEVIFSELYGDAQIQSQFFEIDPKKDTTLISDNGTIIRVFKHSFQRVNDSTEIHANIQLEVKEAFTPIDFVLGNLTTTSDGALLESDGMLYISANADGEALELKQEAEIGVIIPTEDPNRDMSVFSGRRDSTGIDWVPSEPILNDTIISLEQTYITISYIVTGDLEGADVTEWLFKPERKVGDMKMFNEGLVDIVAITRNTVGLRESGNGLFIPEVILEKGKNGYVEDFNTSYIFRIRNLGWTNVDKFYYDPAAEVVQMSVNVRNQDAFGYVFTSLILPEKSMYLRGYQKVDSTFGFTRTDEDRLMLPIGTEGVIMATAYKNDKPYFNFKKFTVENKLDLTLELLETTADSLKILLEEAI